MRKSDFVALGGYDERLMFGWGHGDKDLMRRARAIGLLEGWIPEEPGVQRVIRHSVGDSIRFTIEKDKRASRARHRKLSDESFKRGEYVSNVGQHWGAAKGVRNFVEEFEI